MKKGVILLAYGAPNSLDDVKDFYIDITGGRVPSDAMVEELKDRYRAIGGKTPLLPITQKKAHDLNQLLGDEYKVYIGMRHWHPFIKDAVQQMKDDGITHAVAIVMAPHFSYMSIGKYFQALDDANEQAENPIQFEKIQSWKTHPRYIEALTEQLEEAFSKFKSSSRDKITVIFTAHSLPERILKNNDPYPEELMETARALSKSIGHENWEFAYQSEGRTREPWLGPDLVYKIERLAESGRKSFLVCPIGFISDHLEILYDIDIEAQEEAKKMNIDLHRIRMLNDHPTLIKGFAEMVINAAVWKQMSS